MPAASVVMLSFRRGPGAPELRCDRGEIGLAPARMLVGASMLPAPACRRELKMKNIKLSIVVLPWPNQILYDDLKNSKHARITNSFCQNKCFKLADLYPTIDSYVENNGKKKTIKDVYLKGDMHLSELGHKLIAGHLMNSLMLNN